MMPFLASAYVAETDSAGPYTIISVDPNNAQAYSSDGIQLVSFHKPSMVTSNKDFVGKYFLDQTDTFLIDFPLTDLAVGQTDSVIVDLSGYKLKMSKLQPFLLLGVGPGSITVKVKPYRNGEVLKFPQNTKGKIKFKAIERTPVFTNDAIVMGLLVLILALVFHTSSLPKLQGFYKFVPALLLCYFLPSLLNSFGIISGDFSELYFVSSRYLLPASLILLCLSIDLKGIMRLGPKALIMFFTATAGIIIGGPIALLLCSWMIPDIAAGTGPDELYRGLSTVAGSWIGGGANQAAMKEIYEPSAALFSKMIVVDVIVANIWMAFLLYGAGITEKLNKWFRADASAIDALKEKLEGYSASITRIPKLNDLMTIVAIGLGGVALAHFGAQLIVDLLDPFADTLNAIGLNSITGKFFWLVVIATTYGIILSFTRLRNYEGAGASKMGSVFLYVLVAAIGTHMDIGAIFRDPQLFLIGIIWMAVHVVILLLVAKLIKAPFFFVAVGSQANVGGAASAPIVASAFSPALAPVGVLLAVFGYALGTYGAIVCAELMNII